MKILIVDDSRVARSSIKKVLKNELEADFVEADDGDTALLVLESETPDLIFTDWYMERMDGLNLIKEVRKSNTQVKICMLTSEANEDKIIQALSEGANYVLNKPCKKDELAKALNVLID